MQYNWSSFTKRVNIKSSIEEVYQLWATKSGMEKWFLRDCRYKHNEAALNENEFVKPDDTFEWYWHGWGDDTVEKGKIIFANNLDTLSFTFGQAGAENMICHIKIYQEQNETICELIQENIPEDEKGKTYYHIGCITGWVFYLANMKSILEGGIDLRNKNLLLKNVLNS